MRKKDSVNAGTLPLRRPGQLLLAALLLAYAFDACATDTYVLSTRQLTIPSLVIGAATYSHVVVTVGNIVSGPSGSAPNGTVDTYNPADGELTIQAVLVGATTYYNAVITAEALVSIGSVTGADSFNGTYLTIGSVKAGGASYSHVTLAISAKDVVSVGTGLPTAVQDDYDGATGELTIAAVQVGNSVYTNVVINATITDIEAIGPATTIAQLQKDILGPQCSDCHDGSISTRLPQSLNLTTAAASASALVGVASVEEPNVLRVNPGNPIGSYLIQKLIGAPGTSGVQMPADGPPYLSQAQIDEVNSWILGL